MDVLRPRGAPRPGPGEGAGGGASVGERRKKRAIPPKPRRLVGLCRLPWRRRGLPWPCPKDWANGARS
eukprot:1203853-Pyramimonas_sp.AAC.1